MVETPPSKAWRVWLEKQVRLQQDGTYLVRPWGYWSPIYRVDVATKRRWIRFHVAYVWLVAVGVALVELVKRDDPWVTRRVILCAALMFGVVTTVGFFGPLVIFRHSLRIPKNQWRGPIVVDRWNPHYSPTTYLVLALVCGVIVVSIASGTMFGSAGSFWHGALLVLLFGVLFLVQCFQYLRAPRNIRSHDASTDRVNRSEGQ